MTRRLFDKTIGSLRGVRLSCLYVCLQDNDEKASSKSGHWRFSKRTKSLMAIAIAGVLLISFSTIAFEQNTQLTRWLGINMPTAHSSSSNAAGQPFTTSDWQIVAANAWIYFQPGVGVDPNTGLPYASGTSFEAFTAWDLGVYIQAVIDAQELGLIGTGGAWGSSERLQKVVNFLENRPLNTTTGYPFWYYDATNGQDYHPLSDQATDLVDEADTGRLFVALNNLRNYNSSLAPIIDAVVYNQSNYAALLPGIEQGATSNSVYSYYIDSGFACFWPQQVGNIPSEVMNNIVNLPSVTTYGVSLPDAAITCEPLLCSIFELNNTNAQLDGLMKQVYVASEAYYNSTGEYAAFSEGNSFSSQYIYEWVVLPGVGTWKIEGIQPSGIVNMDPIIFTKVAFGFMALYNSTFVSNMLVYLQKMLPNPAKAGYGQGANSDGQVVPSTGLGTNGLILDAALYAIQNCSTA